LRRTATLAIGIAAVGAYVASAVISGHVSILARRPLLDGTIGAYVYRWVDPPAALARENKRPLPGKASIAITGGKSQAGVFRTRDSQAVVVLLTGALPVAPRTSSFSLTITPLAPSAVAATPSGGLGIVGNVYRIRALAQPVSRSVARLRVGAEVVLVYPKPLTAVRHTLLESTDGTRWRRLHTVDSPVQQQASAEGVTSLGSFAVATPGGGGGLARPGRTCGVLPFLIGAIALVLLLAVPTAEFLRRRRGRTS
jgi:hypothetical protein